jgi:hypothetical protein
MFDFLMDAYAEMSREDLLGHMNGRVPDADKMHTDQLRAIYCEGLVSSSGLFEVVDGVLTSQPARRGRGETPADERSNRN